MTVREAAYSVLEALGAVSDDSWIDKRIALNWLDQARGKALDAYFKANGQDVPPSMVRRYECQLMKTRVPDCDDCEEIRYVDLPVSVFDLENDGGIVSALRPGGKPIPRIGTPGTQSILKNSRFYKGWYRVEDRLYFEGEYPQEMKIHLHLVPSKAEDLELDSPFPAPEAILSDIIDLAIAKGKVSEPEDVVNDGAVLK